MLLQIQKFLFSILKKIQIYTKKSGKQDIVSIVHHSIKFFLLVGLIHLHAFADSAEKTGKNSDPNGTPAGLNGTHTGMNGTPAGLNGTHTGLNGTPAGLNGTHRISATNKPDTGTPTAPFENGDHHFSIQFPSLNGVAVVQLSTQGKTEVSSKELLNTVHDVIKDMVAISANNSMIDKIRSRARSLRKELKNKILSHDLKIPQIIGLLRENILKKNINMHTKYVSIHVLGELLKRYPLSDEVLFSEIVSFLIEKFSDKETSFSVREAAIRAMGKIIERYTLPKEEVPRIFDQLVENSLRGHENLRKISQQVMVQLLHKSFISDPEKRRVIFKVAGRLTSGDKFVREEAVKVLHEFVERDILSSPDDIKKITPKIAARLDDKKWGIQARAVRAFHTFLEKGMLSESDIKIFLKIAGFIFSEHGILSNYSHKILKALWKSDFISSEKKLDVLYEVAEGLSDAQHGQKNAISVLRAGTYSGLPLDYEIIQIVVDKAFEKPDLLGTAEQFVEYALELENINLSDPERIILVLEKEKMRSLRISSSRQNLSAERACYKTMQSYPEEKPMTH